MNKKPVTAWYTFNLDKPGWDFNHIQDGHVPGDHPIGTPDQNSAWKGKQWKKEHKNLIDGKLV